MTGIFMRVRRDERWQNLDITEMTDAEIADAMSGRDASELSRWVVALAGWIRDNVVVAQPNASEEDV